MEQLELFVTVRDADCGEVLFIGEDYSSAFDWMCEAGVFNDFMTDRGWRDYDHMYVYSEEFNSQDWRWQFNLVVEGLDM